MQNHKQTQDWKGGHMKSLNHIYRAIDRLDAVVEDGYGNEATARVLDYLNNLALRLEKEQ